MEHMKVAQILLLSMTVSVIQVTLEKEHNVKMR